MLDTHDTWTADDLPTLEGSEVSAISPYQLRLIEDGHEDESGMRWLLERPEALLDVHRYGEAIERRSGMRGRKPATKVR